MMMINHLRNQRERSICKWLILGMKGSVLVVPRWRATINRISNNRCHLHTMFKRVDRACKTYSNNSNNFWCNNSNRSWQWPSNKDNHPQIFQSKKVWEHLVNTKCSRLPLTWAVAKATWTPCLCSNWRRTNLPRLNNSNSFNNKCSHNSSNNN